MPREARDCSGDDDAAVAEEVVERVLPFWSGVVSALCSESNRFALDHTTQVQSSGQEQTCHQMQGAVEIGPRIHLVELLLGLLLELLLLCRRNLGRVGARAAAQRGPSAGTRAPGTLETEICFPFIYVQRNGYCAMERSQPIAPQPFV